MTGPRKPATGTTRRVHAEQSVPQPEDENVAELIPKNRRRRANVYDAVAGRVSTNGFIPLVPHRSMYRDTLSSNLNPINPEEVLFRMKGATPDLFHEEVYFANETIPPTQSLPDSDMLKAIHTYASDYYASGTTNHGLSDWRSLDGAALIALGILLEEAARESLGETGDLEFVEGEGTGSVMPVSNASKDSRKRSKSRLEGNDGTQDSLPLRKRRRLSSNIIEDDPEAVLNPS